MTEPKWLVQTVIEVVHDMQIAEHGGLPGIRDEGLLNSALARPKNLYEYEGADLYQLATAYASSLVRNHPFADGNKRIALLAVYIFLEINDITLVAPEVDATAVVFGLASGEISEEQFTYWLKRHSVKQFNQ